MPVLFGILTPLTFTSNGICIRLLTRPQYGMNFKGELLSFSSYFIVNLIILIFAVVFWQFHPFNRRLFWIGTVGSIINTIGIGCITMAIQKGPMGPVSALSATSNILLVIVEAIRNQKVPSWIELLALVFGFLGGLELVFPEIFEKLFCRSDQVSE